MSITVLGKIASDLAEVAVPANGGDWRMAWHPPDDAASGRQPGRPVSGGARTLA
jgi:hypothetical protein